MGASLTNPRIGLAHPNVVDVVTHDRDKDHWKLIIVETTAWDGSTERLLKLQQKLNNYLTFILDGQMHQLYPESVGKIATIQLDCYEEPDDETLLFVQRAKEEVAAEGITLCLNIVPKTTGHA